MAYAHTAYGKPLGVLGVCSFRKVGRCWKGEREGVAGRLNITGPESAETCGLSDVIKCRLTKVKRRAPGVAPHTFLAQHD